MLMESNPNKQTRSDRVKGQGAQENNVYSSTEIGISTETVFSLGRRLSGMPLNEQQQSYYQQIEDDQLDALNKIIAAFPDPPLLDSASSSNSSHESGASQTTNRTNGGWGSIRGIAEKLYPFGRMS